MSAHGCGNVVDELPVFSEKKERSILLSEIYRQLGMTEKAYNVEGCSNNATFLVCPHCKHREFKSADFCGDALCPVCNWRRSKGVNHTVTAILQKVIKSYPNSRYISLSLSTQGVEIKKLHKEFNKVVHSWKLLCEHNRFKKVYGWLRMFDVIYSEQSWYPYLHCISQVPVECFNQQYALQYKEMWKEILKVDYQPLVDIRLIEPKNNINEMIKQMVDGVNKFTVKDLSFTEDNISEAVPILDETIRNKTFVTYGGTFKDKQWDFLDEEKYGYVLHNI